MFEFRGVVLSSSRGCERGFELLSRMKLDGSLAGQNRKDLIVVGVVVTQVVTILNT